MSKSKQSRRAVIVGGARTPFVRAFEEFAALDTIALGVAAVGGLLERHTLPWEAIDAIVWGGVILPSSAPNVGREIALDLGLPPSVEARTVTRACASGLQAITDAVCAIERGDADVVIAGGSDSTSNAELKLPQSLVRKVAPVAMNRKSGPLDYLGLLGQLSLHDLIPQQPKIAERSTGQVMGEAADEMAERNGVTRQEQDAFAVRSHHRAAAAMASGRFGEEVVPVTPKGRAPVYADTLVRADTTVEKISGLRPVFRRQGTITAATASPLTDGAAAVLLMTEEKARSLEMKALAAFRSWAYVGVDPADQLLMGPALAMPKALERAGLRLDEIDVVDMHEAFAGQVLSVLRMLASQAFAQARLGREEAVGNVDMDRLNVHGGSVAIGHPFGATGARMVLTMARELALTGKKTALLGICAAGGLGAGAVLEAL